MRSEDWFAVAVRVVGVVILMTGLGLLLDYLLQRLRYYSVADTPAVYYLIFGCAEVMAGIYLTRGAPLLVWFAFPRDEEEVGSEDNQNGD